MEISEVDPVSKIIELNNKNKKNPYDQGYSNNQEGSKKKLSDPELKEEGKGKLFDKKV